MRRFVGTKNPTYLSHALTLLRSYAPRFGQLLAVSLAVSRPGGIAFVLLLVCLLAPATVLAQQPDQPKQPAPPLFPKHRRGLYRNNRNIIVIDATPQSPPLQIDDPSVPDEGEYEINLTPSVDFSRGLRRVDLLRVDANYGVLPKVMGHELPTQVKLEFPIAAQRESGQPFVVGIGTAAFGLKFNFYNNENRGIRISVYPQLEFSTGGGVTKGIADPGQAVVLPLLVSKEFKYATFVANGEVEKPFHAPERRASAEFGFGAGRALTRKVALMLDFRSESTLDFADSRTLSVDAGVIHGVRNVIVYARLGRTLLSDDGPHTYLAVGMKIILREKN